MGLDSVRNFAFVTASQGYDDEATSITLVTGDGAKLPATAPYNLAWWNDTNFPNPSLDPNREIVRVTARSGDTLTIARGQETTLGGLAASTKNAVGATYKLALLITAKTIDDIDKMASDIGAQFYVTDYGAKGDGTTQDAAAIQAAIDAATAGGMVIFPTGTWLINAKLTVAKKIRLLGYGPTSIIKASGTAMTALVEFNAGAEGASAEYLRLEGSKSGTGGTIQRGFYINGAKDVTVQFNQLSGPNSTTGLNFGVDVNGPNSSRARVRWNKIDRLVSSSQNGTAVLLEGTTYCEVIENYIDGSELNNADSACSAAILLSQLSDGNACTDNIVRGNTIKEHKQAGIAIGSTTYCEFQTNLGLGERNLIEDNKITLCSAAGGGDASSGIVIQANSSYNRIARNHVHHCGHSSGGGYGIVVVGVKGVAKAITGATNATPIVITATAHGLSNGNQVGVSGVLGNTAANGTWTVANKTNDTLELQGSVGNGAYTSGGLIGVTGTAKIDEVPIYNVIEENCVHHNKDDGIYLKGPRYTTVRGNQAYENGQRTANTFRNLHLTRLGSTGPTGDDNYIMGNTFLGTQPKYQVEIVSGGSGAPAACFVLNNIAPQAGTGKIVDGGTNTLNGNYPP